jgi:hypothetical protein
MVRIRAPQPKIKQCPKGAFFNFLGARIGASASAAPIRECTIRKILKNRPTEIFLIFIIVYRGTRAHSREFIQPAFCRFNF